MGEEVEAPRPRRREGHARTAWRGPEQRKDCNSDATGWARSGRGASRARWGGRRAGSTSVTSRVPSRGARRAARERGSTQRARHCGYLERHEEGGWGAAGCWRGGGGGGGGRWGASALSRGTPSPPLPSDPGPQKRRSRLFWGWCDGLIALAQDLGPEDGRTRAHGPNVAEPRVGNGARRFDPHPPTLRGAHEGLGGDRAKHFAAISTGRAT
jgi:hypothetical protein